VTPPDGAQLNHQETATPTTLEAMAEEKERGGECHCRSPLASSSVDPGCRLSAGQKISPLKFEIDSRDRPCRSSFPIRPPVNPLPFRQTRQTACHFPEKHHGTWPRDFAGRFSGGTRVWQRHTLSQASLIPYHA
jgi:hypothetical protein